MGLRLRAARPGRRRAGRPTTIGAFTEAVRDGPAGGCRARVSHLRIDPEIEADGPLDPDGALRRALRERRLATRAADPAQRDADHRPAADEDALWGDLRKKWRQYVNKARTAGITVVDADGDRLGEFYRIYRETADRAGFLIRAESAYRDVWEAFAPSGRARLLFAQTPDGEPQATLFLVRCGPRVVEPYGGMTAAGGESRANYLLKWEAIRTSRERAPRATTCGASRPAGSPTSRPASAAARSATSARGTSSSTRSAGRPTSAPSAPASGGRGGAAASARRRRAPRRTGRPIEPSATATPGELDDWDARTVDAPGGHVYQSRAWASIARRRGWQPRFLVDRRRRAGRSP